MLTEKDDDGREEKKERNDPQQDEKVFKERPENAKFCRGNGFKDITPTIAAAIPFVAFPVKAISTVFPLAHFDDSSHLIVQKNGKSIRSFIPFGC